MKKRILPLLLAVLMVCALLPFGAYAADLSPYKSLIRDVAYTDDYGLLKDLNGDGVEELFMMLSDADGNPYGVVYTIANGAVKKLIEAPYTNVASGYSDIGIVSSGNYAFVVTTKETNTDAGSFNGKGVYWNDGVLTYYQLSNGSLQQTDVMRYKLLMEYDSNQFFVDRSTITYNGRTISGDEMNAVFARVDDNMLDVYPMQQVYDAVQGFFQDVPADQYYAVPVGWALDHGITTGTSSVDFSPTASCTRGQVVTFLWRAAGKPAPTSTRNPFGDVKPSDYFYNAVLWAVEKGITNGTSATTFSPNDPCTRGQVVTFLWRYSGMPKTGGSNPFYDVSAGAYYYDAVLWAVGHNVTNGVSATAFGPDQTCTRAQIVTFLYRAIA